MRFCEVLDRLRVIKKLEEKFQSKVITFYRNRLHITNGNEGIINERTFDDFQLALEEIGETTPLTVLINSVGGYTFTGYRIATCLYERVGEVRIIVPEQALSAATLIAISGKHLIMHPNAILSPVDPQFLHGDNFVSALDLMESDDSVIKTSGRRMIEQSKQYVRSLCEGKFDTEQKIQKIIQRLLLEDRVHPSHISPIRPGEIRTLGFPLKIEMDLDIRALHNLYKRHNFCEHDPSIIIEYLRDPVSTT